MIESITIANVATFAITPEALNGLSQFNFLFGSNGTGKTTVSRVGDAYVEEPPAAAAVAAAPASIASATP